MLPDGGRRQVEGVAARSGCHGVDDLRVASAATDVTGERVLDRLGIVCSSTVDVRLGGEQHGHINAIGFDMYVRMLEDTVRELRGEEVAPEVHSSLNLGLDLRIPSSYIEDENQRLRAYKRIAQAVDSAEREKVEQEFADRYGPVPDEVRHLLALMLEPGSIALDNARRIAQAEALSVTDDLTRLYNGRFLRQSLTREVKRAVRSRAPLTVNVSACKVNS